MKKLLDFINRVEMVIAMTGVCAFTIIVFCGAVARVFGHPLNWSMDMALFLLAWSTFLGGDVAFRAGRLVNVGLLIAVFPKKVQKAFVVLVYALILVFLVTMVYNGVKLCGTTVHRTFNGIPGFSYMWVTLAIPVSFSFMCLTAVSRLIFLLKTDDMEAISKM